MAWDKIRNETTPVDTLDTAFDKVNALIDNTTQLEKRDNIDAKTAAYTLVKDADFMITVTPAADVTITLPTVTTCSGQVFIIILISESYTLTIDAGSGVYIDGNLRYLYMTQLYSFAKLVSNGTKWFIIGPK